MNDSKPPTGNGTKLDAHKSTPRRHLPDTPPRPVVGKVNNVEINRLIASSRTVEQIEKVVGKHVADFNIINCATALHRIAKVCHHDPTNRVTFFAIQPTFYMLQGASFTRAR